MKLEKVSNTASDKICHSIKLCFFFIDYKLQSGILRNQLISDD